MDLSVSIQRVAIAAALGFLVGLQRERADSQIAGIRTFTIIALFGALTGILSSEFGGWGFAVGAIAVAILLLAGNLSKLRSGDIEPGLTTEMAALAVYALGAYLMVGYVELAVAVGGGLAILLHAKRPLHDFVDRIGEQDLKAMMQFVLIALVIFPILPNVTYGPYNVLNPRQIWQIVVLIVGISLIGYVGYKLFGQNAGVLLSGFLGGLISSTATTVSFARRSKENPQGAAIAALVVMIASTVAFARMLVEIGIVAPRVLWQTALPLCAMLGLMTVLSTLVYLVTRKKPAEFPAHGNPTNLRAAIVFAGLYAIISLAVAAAKDYFGPTSLYVLAMVSGLTDVDAITLSTAEMVKREAIAPELGWRLMLVAALSNLGFKAGAVAVLGNRRMFLMIALLFGLAIAGGVAMLFLWPAEWAPAAPVWAVGQS